MGINLFSIFLALYEHQIEKLEAHKRKWDKHGAVGLSHFRRMKQL